MKIKTTRGVRPEGAGAAVSAPRPRGTRWRSTRGSAMPLFALFAIAALGLAGCSSGGNSSNAPASSFKPGVLNKNYKGTTLEVALPPYANMPTSQLSKFTALTGVKVHMQSIAYDVVHDKMVTAGAANQAFADIVEMDPAWVGQFGAAGWLTPLKSWLPATTISQDLGSSVFNYHGDPIALPYNLDFRGSIVNMTMLNKAGITKPPSTYAELISDAEAIKAKGVVKYPVALPLSITEGTSTPWFALVRAAGDAILTNGKPGFQENGVGAGALDLIHQLYAKGLIDKASIGLTDQQVGNQYGVGQSAILLSAGPGGLSTYADKTQSKISTDTLAFTPMPTPDGTHVAGAMGLEDGMGIPKASKAKEAAAMFIYWWMQQPQLAVAYNSVGLVPPNAQALSTLVAANKLRGGQTVVNVAKTIKPVFDGGAPTWYPKFSNSVASTVQSVAVGNKSADQGVKDLVNQVNTLSNSQ